MKLSLLLHLSTAQSRWPVLKNEGEEPSNSLLFLSFAVPVLCMPGRSVSLLSGYLMLSQF